GKSNPEISRELYMSLATVKAHVSRVLEKLEFNNRVRYARTAAWNHRAAVSSFQNFRGKVAPG
ncbi:MAG: response regulator transcription factor, partial [Solirubrobacterales bacterium]|nr:response regulator transcription factor [Solirubrobacterales bacterium]